MDGRTTTLSSAKVRRTRRSPSTRPTTYQVAGNPHTACLVAALAVVLAATVMPTQPAPTAPRTH